MNDLASEWAETAEYSGFVAGVDNLLRGCLGAQAGERLVIFHEPPGHQHYCEQLPNALAQQAQRLGYFTTLAEVPVIEDANALTDEHFAPALTADHVVYLARCGDQMRFESPPQVARSVICYAMNAQMMASPFAGIPHALMVAVKTEIDSMFANAKHILIECSNGTYIEQHQPTSLASLSADTQIARFPLSVCQPVLAAGLTGRIVIPNFLVGTGSRYFSPFGVDLQEPLTALIQSGRIIGFEGLSKDVAAAQDLHARVADRYKIDPNVVHSWHAGIHPGLDYDMPARANFERWSGAAFGNQRILHFHTCGDYAPGEISWNVIDPTVTVDGVTLWHAGRLQPQALPNSHDLLKESPAVMALFNDPATNIGL